MPLLYWLCGYRSRARRFVRAGMQAGMRCDWARDGLLRQFCGVVGLRVDLLLTALFRLRQQLSLHEAGKGLASARGG